MDETGLMYVQGYYIAKQKSPGFTYFITVSNIFVTSYHFRLTKQIQHTCTLNIKLKLKFLLKKLKIFHIIRNSIFKNGRVTAWNKHFVKWIQLKPVYIAVNVLFFAELIHCNCSLTITYIALCCTVDKTGSCVKEPCRY